MISARGHRGAGTTCRLAALAAVPLAVALLAQPLAAADAAELALERAIAETREAPDARLLARAAITMAIATAVFVLLPWRLYRVGRWLTLRMLKLAEAASARVRASGGELVRSHRALRFPRTAVRAAGWIPFPPVAFEWLGFVLGLFPRTRAWSESPMRRRAC